MSLIRPCNFAWDKAKWPNLHAINPYRGCAFDCSYPCWSKVLAARFGTKRDWANVEVSPEIKDERFLTKLLHRLRISSPMTVLVGSQADPMPPLELDHEITNLILKAFWCSGRHTYLILTKNPAIVQYSDLLRNINAWVGMSLTARPAFYKEVQAKFELGAPLNSERVEALRQLHQAGVRTFASIEPWLAEEATFEWTVSSGRRKSKRGYQDYTNPASIITLTHEFVDYYIVGSWNRNGKPLKHLIPYYREQLPHVIETLKLYGKEYWIKTELLEAVK